jgi:cellulase/cellobiase CelA1
MNENTTSEERVRILRMLEEGKITAEQAIGLMNAVGGNAKVAGEASRATASPIVDPLPTPNPPYEPVSETPAKAISQSDLAAKNKWRYFRVRVTDTKSGKAKAMVTIPIGLMEWGLKIGAQFSPEVSQINVADFNALMESGLDGKLVDVIDEEDGEHVEVFVE